MDYVLSTFDYHLLAVTAITIVLFSWTLHEIMERMYNMRPRITTTVELQQMSNTADDVEKAFEMNNRLTRSLNSEGGYRIQQRGAVFFIKSLLQFTASLYFIVICLFEPQWFVDHFINLKADSINYLPCLQLVVAVPCHYTWEIVGIRYEKLDVFMLIHHWFSSIMAIAMICGLYTPFGVWYGFSMAGLVFPISFMRGFRNQYSLLYPEFTRKAFAICSWYYVALIVMNWTGQLSIIINSLLNHYNESISVWLILVMLVTMSALSYDDYLLFKSLRAYSDQRYELATILGRERQELILPDIAEGRSDTEVYPTSP